jgi:hypothetical protein
MPKFYVDCGEFKTILAAENHKDAAIKAFKKLENNPVNYLNDVTQISEKGFSSDCPRDMWFLTKYILQSAGLDQSYKDMK